MLRLRWDSDLAEDRKHDMSYYPIFLDLRGKACLVVGGGDIATRKVEGLLSAAADVTVISPDASELIHRHAQLKRLCHLPRCYQDGDLKGYVLAYAATGVVDIDVRMAREAHARGVLLNVVDRAMYCDFITPAVVQRGDLSIAISTGGRSPGFAKRLKQKMEAWIHPEYGPALADLGAQRRALMRNTSLDKATRNSLLGTNLELTWKKLERTSPVDHEEYFR